MRLSSRETILDVAADIARSQGIGGLTFESLASAAGLSRGGIIYHFPSKGAMIAALYEHISHAWEKKLLSALPRSFSQSTPVDRLRAYISVSTDSASQNDLALLLAPEDHPWRDVIRRWTPTPDEACADPILFTYFVIRLAADGLWAHDALSGDSLDAALRHRVVAALNDLAAQQSLAVD